MPGSFIVIAVLLCIGLCFRAKLGFLAKASIPASVIAGIIGMGLAQGAPRWSHTADRYASIRAELGVIADLAIAVVFAALLLLPQRDKLSRSKHVWQQGITAWIIILGQLALGLFITALVIKPYYAVPAPFGQLIEVTMAGGFGSANAMGTLLASKVYDFPEGRDILVFGATFGLVFGVITGIPLAKLGAKLGWTSSNVAAEIMRADSTLETRRLGSDVIDPLLLQGLFLVISIGAGMGMKWLIAAIASSLDAHLHTAGQFAQYLGDLPLFFFALLGGWIVRVILQLLKLDAYLDDARIHNFSGAAIDILIVASLTRVQFASITTFLMPTLLLLLVGSAWSIFCLLWLSRRLLPQAYWFELGLINYGFSTAATAQGMMFLKLVDKDMRSGAAETYALAAPITAPFIGGGIITFAVLPPLLSSVGLLPMALIISAITLGFYLTGRKISRE